MAKFTWSQASKDDPIFSGRFVISSKNSPPLSKETPKTLGRSSTETPGQQVRFRHADEARLRELGMLGNSELVISLGRTKGPGQSPPASTKK